MRLQLNFKMMAWKGEGEAVFQANVSMIMKMKISRVRLITANLHECLSFYQKVGFQLYENAGKYALSARSFRIEVIALGRQLPPKPKNSVAGCLELSIEVDTPLLSVVSRLRKLGVEPEHIRSSPNGGIESAVYRDPDGNLLELIPPR